MTFSLFDSVDSDGKNLIKEWTMRLDKIQRAKLNAKLDMLEKLGMDLLPEILTGTDTPGILKLRIKGNVQLRPMLCRGPFDKENEFTLLIGAIEKGNKLKPRKADEIANGLKNEILKESKRRVPHERVS